MFLIDGHNLTFADEEAHQLLKAGKPNESRVRVLELVETVVGGEGERAMVVFDGTGGGTPPSPRGQVSYRFSGQKREADDEIKRLLRNSSGCREVCVVTGDREVLATAKALGAKTITALDFLAEADRVQRRRSKRPPAPEPRAKRTGPTQSEVNELLTVFREEDAAAIEKEEMHSDGEQPRRRRPRVERTTR